MRTAALLRRRQPLSKSRRTGSHRGFAKRLSMLSQGAEAPPGYLVEDLVALGRYPYQSWLRQWSDEDETAVDRAMRATGISDLRWREVESLSGGQRQRVWLAMVLAQQAPVLLLDEPTTFLDMAHQIEVLDLIREMNRREGKTVVMVLHDLGQASRYSDYLVAMKAGSVAATGAPQETTTPAFVRDIFEIDCAIVPDPVSGRPLVLPPTLRPGRADGRPGSRGPDAHGDTGRHGRPPATGPKTRAGRRMCAVLTRDRGEDPIGHALPYERIIVAELPKPWPRRAIDGPGASPALLDLFERFQALRRRASWEYGEAGVKARGLNVALVHVAPDPVYSLPGHRRIFHLTRPKGPFSTYRKQEFQVPEADAAELLEALLYQGPVHRWLGALAKDTANVRELLVCTHGSRDTCCGTLGYPLYAQLRGLADSTGGALRVWQATHFQFHRFAPVVLDLPEARVWGAVDPDRAETLALRNRPPQTLRDCYIGWSGVEQDYMQAAEREALVREGWAWTTYRKSGRLIRLDDGQERAHVQLDFTLPDGATTGSYRATVEVSGHVPGLVGCLSPGQTRDTPQYRVSGVTRTVRPGPSTSARQGIERSKELLAPASPC